MRSRAALASLIVLLFAGPARAQADFGRLPIEVGDVVYVTTPAGVEIGGRVTRLSPTALSIDGYEFTPETALKIERPGDSLRNGALIGFGVGAFIGAGLYRETCAGRTTCLSRAAVMLQAGVSEAALGAFLDWLHVGRTPLYRATSRHRAPAFSLAPSVTPTGKGVALAISF